MRELILARSDEYPIGHRIRINVEDRKGCPVSVIGTVTDHLGSGLVEVEYDSD